MNLWLGTPPPGVLLRLEAAEPVDEVGARRRQRGNSASGRVAAAGADADDEAAVAEGRLVPGEIRHLVGDRELDCPADSRDRATDGPGAVERVGRSPAGEHLDVRGRGPEPFEGLAGLVDSASIVEDREHPTLEVDGGAAHSGSVAMSCSI